MIRKAGTIFITAYLLIMFGIYPLYMRQGYTNIGEDKYQFFLYVSLGTIAILAVITIIRGIRKLIRFKHSSQVRLIDWDKVSFTDTLVLMYASFLFCSHAFSNYAEAAMWGTKGWHMGLVTWLILLALYFFITRMWEGNKIVWYLSVIVSGVVCLLAILDRFSAYLIPIENRATNFLSTIGNINWLCGYLSVTIPIGAVLFILGEKLLHKCLLGIYLWISFMACLVQGGNSIFLFIGALFFMLLWIGVQKYNWMQNWFILVAVWGFSAQGIRILRWVSGDAYNYDTNNLCGYFTDSSLTLWIGLGSLCMYLGVKLLNHYRQENLSNTRYSKVIHKCMGFGLIAVIGIWLILITMNTLWGIPGLDHNRMLLMTDDWGNGRGSTFRAGIWTFREMSLTQKLLGAGPDCFSAQAYSLPDVAVYLRNNFGSSRLTNAHNELLTCLVNNGILGLLAYVGMLLTFLIRSMKGALARPILYVPVVCVICYLVHNMVSFAQVLNLPFAIFMMAMGEQILTNPRDLPTIRIQFSSRKEEE